MEERKIVPLVDMNFEHTLGKQHFFSKILSSTKLFFFRMSSLKHGMISASTSGNSKLIPDPSFRRRWWGGGGGVNRNNVVVMQHSTVVL